MIDRVLGFLGIVGGLLLLAAFVPGIPWDHDVFNLRLVLFNGGAMAVVVGIARRPAFRDRPWATAVAVAALVANGWYLVMVVLSIGRPIFPEPDPDFRPIFFYAAIALWLTDAAFGFAAWRVRTVPRLPALALAVGSLLALTGVGGLGFTTSPLATIFEPLALAGIVLVGLGWIGLGFEIARGAAGRNSRATVAVRPATGS